MNIDELTRPREQTLNVPALELPEWARGEKKIAPGGPAVRAMAQNLIDAVREHRHLQNARVAIVMRSGVKATAEGRVLLGKARRAGPLLGFLSKGADFLMELNAAAWAAGGAVQKLALLDHELSHCGVAIGSKFIAEAAVDQFVGRLGSRHVATRSKMRDSDGSVCIVYALKEAGGRPKFGLRKHDVESFCGVAGRWGPWTNDLKRLDEAMMTAEPPTRGAKLFEKEPLPASRQEQAETADVH